MNLTVLVLIFLLVVFLAIVFYALYLGRDIKALLKLPFAFFSFETKREDIGKEDTILRHRLQSVRDKKG